MNACIRAILEHSSVVLSSSDIALAIRRSAPAIRQRVVPLMIQKGLLREGHYFARKLVQRVKLVKGFAKQVPSLNDESSRFNFINILNEFDISWPSFQSYFDLTKEGVKTKFKGV